MEKNMNKKTYLIKARPGSFFMEVSKEKIENDLSLDDIIKKYITLDEVKKESYKTICFFVVEEKIGRKTKATKCHIGEKYSLTKIVNEFGKDCFLYDNIKYNDYQSAIRYIPGNFGGVNKEDICFTQKEIVNLIKETNMELKESL